MSLQHLFHSSLRSTPRLSQVRFQHHIFLVRQPALLHGTHGSASVTARIPRASSPTFSTSATLFDTQIPRNGSSGSRSTAEKTGPEQEDPFHTPSVSLESLGIGKNMKVFLFAVLCVLGTIETWFWCKAIWIWWKGGQSEYGD